MNKGLQAIIKNNNALCMEYDKEEISDGFQLRFVGKSYAKYIKELDTETMLVPDVDWNTQEENKNSENVFITGDNLEALKHLQKAYSNKIKLIYIDPPYNTGGGDFVYQDSFKFSDKELEEKLGLSSDEIEKVKSLKGKSSHSAWLTFMYPRLALAKRLLTEDGVIFISIDDNEQANLKLICDEIFGESFVDIMIWRKSGASRDGKMKNTTTFRKDHEYLIVAFHNVVQLNKSFEKPSWQNSYNNPDNDPRGAYKAGSISKKEEASNPNHKNYYTVTSPAGKTFTRQFDVSQEEFMKLNEDGRIYWGKNNEAVPSIKIFENEKRIVTTSSYLVEDDYDFCVIDNEEMTTTKGTKELQELLDIDSLGEEFRPKPSELLKKVIQIGMSNDDIILDFFAGSATTAHAVMDLNKEDGGSRKYIMVQLDEPVKENSVAEQNGYKTIDEISRKRIKNAAQKLEDTSGFKHYKIASVSDKNVLAKIEDFNPHQPLFVNSNKLSLDDFSGRSLNTDLSAAGRDTLLATWLIADGFAFNADIKKLKIKDYIAYSPDEYRSLYFINEGWNSEHTKEFLNMIGTRKQRVNTIYLYNHSFDFTNLTELKNNLKSVLDAEKQINIIERF